MLDLLHAILHRELDYYGVLELATRLMNLKLPEGQGYKTFTVVDINKNGMMDCGEFRRILQILVRGTSPTWCS